MSQRSDDDNWFGFDAQTDDPPDVGDHDAPPFAHIPAVPVDDEGQEISPIEPGVPAAPTEEAPQAPEDGESPAPQAPEATEEQIAEWQSRYVGEGKKYATAEQLEQGYDHAVAMGQRELARARTVQQENAELRQLLEQAVTQLQATAQPAPPAPTGPTALSPEVLAAAQNAGLEPEQVQLLAGLASREADARVAALRGELTTQRQQELLTAQQRQQQAEQQRALEAGRSSIDTFRQTHPEATPDVEARMGQIIVALDLDLTDPIMLETAHEAANDPHLLKVLQANPDLTETDAGMEVARSIARTLAPAPAAPAPAAPTGAAPALPHVETGGRGPAPAEPQAGSWDKVLKLVKEENSTSPLGI